MKLTIKSLKQIPYDVEVESDQVSIKDLKKEIENLHGFDHTTLKLVFNGVVLDDSKKLHEFNIKEANVIVMMNAKAKPVNVQKEEVKIEDKQVDKSLNQNTSSNIQTQNTTKIEPIKNTERDYSSQVKTLLEFGFPKEECEAAVKAAKGDVNIATEFLLNGIPNNLYPDEHEGVSINEGLDSNSPSALLKNIASVVKVLCYNNPSQLQNILLTLQQNSPELMALIRENEEEFKNMIQQPITDNDMTAFQEFNRQATGESSSGQRENLSQSHDGRDVIKLNKQDYDAVGRLKELGFSEMDAVQAFFACDKNEDAAANFLWENKLKEQDQEMFIDCKNPI